MVNQGEHEFFWKGCSRRVVHCGGEGHEDRVSFKGEDNPSEFQERGLVVDRATEDSADLGGQALLFYLTEGETLCEVFKGGGVQGGLCVLRSVCEVVYGSRDDD